MNWLQRLKRSFFHRLGKAMISPALDAAIRNAHYWEVEYWKCRQEVSELAKKLDERQGQLTDKQLVLLSHLDAIRNLTRENERLRQGLGDPHAQLTSEGIDGLSNWRLAVETALGLEHDPVSHTPEWAHKLILHMREIGNAKQETQLRPLTDIVRNDKSF